MDVPLDGVAFTTGLTIRGSQIFGFWGVTQFFIFLVSKRTRMFVLQVYSKVFFIKLKKKYCRPIHKNRKLLS